MTSFSHQKPLKIIKIKKTKEKNSLSSIGSVWLGVVLKNKQQMQLTLTTWFSFAPLTV